MSNTIKSWGISDFKSLANVDVSSVPLTVLTGANSSGKSSTLQSMLLLGQSVNRGGAIVLNGPLIRLGGPLDVVRAGQKTMQFKIKSRLSDRIQRQLGEVPDSDVTISISVAADKEASTLSATSFDVMNDSGKAIISATASRIVAMDRAIVQERVGAESTVLRITEISGKRAENRMYLVLDGLIPTEIVVHKNKKDIKRIFKDSAEMRLTEGGQFKGGSFEVLMELSELVDKRSFMNDMGSTSKESDKGESTKFKRRQESSIQRWSQRSLLELDRSQTGQLLEQAAQARAEDEWVVVSTWSTSRFYYPRVGRSRNWFANEGLVEEAVSKDLQFEILHIGMVAEAITQFGSSICYLGPLRDEPKVVHGAWDERVDSLPVGIKGELTAEVLTRQRDQIVEYRNSQNQIRRDSLPDAVAAWCSYFEIGDHIKVLDLGKLGRGVELRVNGVYRDLTTIGVGASQILPVLVAGLTVDSGSTLLIEQPELHLHPLVQSRLADFFLFARKDVNFIIETHSEYMVTRIRRRVAEKEIHPQKVQVLFAEQDAGITSVETLNMTDLGDFTKWPKGFFDAQENDSLNIAKAIANRLIGQK